MKRRIHPRFLLLVLIFFLIVNNIIWLRLGGRPQHWDSAIHLIETLNANRIGETQHRSLWKQALSVSWYYPPLVSYISVPFYRILGDSEFSALQVMTLFLVILVASVYGIGTRLYGEEAGLLASLLAASFPIVIEYSHTFMLDLPLAAIVTLAVFLFSRTELIQHTGYCVLLGIVVGCGMLTKWTFLTYAGVPIVYCSMKAIRTSEKRQRIVLNLIVALLVASAVIAPWYLVHAVQIATSRIEFLTQENRTFMESFLFFFKAIPEQTSWVLVILLLVGIVTGMWKYRSEHVLPLLWFLSAYVLNSLIGFKHPRHSIALLPPLAVIGAAGLLAAVPARRAAIAIAALALVVYLTASYVPPATSTGTFLSTPFISGAILRVDGPAAQDWRTPEILRAVEKDRVTSERQKVVLRVIPDHQYFNNSTFQYYAKLHRYPVAVAGTSGSPIFTDYVLLKYPGVGEDSPEHSRERLTDTLLALRSVPSSLYQTIETFSLPDHSQAILLRVTPHAVEGPHASDVVDLTRRTVDQFVRKYFRRLGEYEISVHEFDSSATVAGRLRDIFIAIPKAEFGDFAFNPVGVPVSDVDIELGNVTLDPRALLEKNELQIVSIEKLFLNGIAIAGGDLKNYIQESSNGKVTVGAVEMNSGNLIIRGYSQDLGARFRIALQLSLINHENIAFRFQEARIGIVPLPASLLNIVTDAFNPLITGLDVLSEVRIKDLHLERDTLRVGR